jgi:transcription elongation factor Elf1
VFTGAGSLMLIVGIDEQMSAEKPLFMAVCSKCGARCFVPVPDPEPAQIPGSKEAAHPAKRKVRFTCLRCGHEQFTER